MQEYVQEKSVAITVQGAKLTGRLLFRSLRAIWRLNGKIIHGAHQKIKNPQLKVGKQSVKQLTRHNRAVSSMTLNDSGLRLFKRITKKYHVNFAIRRDKTATGPIKKWTIFFQADHADLINSAFSEFTAKMLKRTRAKAHPRPSVLAQLRQLVKLLGKRPPVKQKERAR